MDKSVLNKLPVSVKDVPALTNKGGIIKVLISPKTVQATKLIMGVAELKPGETLIEHVHDYGEEVFFVKSGSGSLFIDDTEITLSPDAAVIIPQGCRHKIVNSGTTLLALVFAAAPLAPTAQKGDRVTQS